MSVIEQIANIRAYEPEKIAQALKKRPKAQIPKDQKLLIIACDHPARGALGAGRKPMAMGSREDLLERCAEALSRPGVHGFLGTAEMIEDLTLMGALDNKLVWGSMNRGGLQHSKFEMDDRFNCYTPKGIEEAGLNGGKTLSRINFEDPATVATLESTAQAINQLAERKLTAMVEPFISEWKNGTVVNNLSTDAVIRSITIAAGLGTTSAYTWLKLPCVDNMERVMASTTLPSLILGGEVPDDPDEALKGWAGALKPPNVKGLVIGRSLLFPPTGTVSEAVDATVSLL